MKQVALALTLLLVAACDLPVSNSSVEVEIDAGPVPMLTDGGTSECGQNPCLNDGECTLTNAGIQCTCKPGYEGEHCEINVDDCKPNPCLNGGVCTDGVASYSCACASGFEGVDCSTNIDDCADAPCLNNGTCTDKVNGYQCDCAAGYSGTQCEVDVDDCSPNPCQYNGVCVDAVNAFTCVCKEGHNGVICTDTVESCKDDTCQNAGTCENGPDGYTCTCAPGFNGVNCETDIDDCATMPCENGAICTDKVNGYTCQCPEGMTGVNCETSLDPCDPNPCQNGAECSSAGSDSFVCSCVAGYKGASCEINIDDCATNPCANGGTCTDGVNDFTCECPTGYTGHTCNSEPPSCPAVDPCEHGTCQDGVDGFRCECEPGFIGVRCEVNVDDCNPDPCDHGTCVDGANSFTCNCDPGYQGSACEINTDDCINAHCLHGGTCVDEVAGFHCDCAVGYAGADCSVNIDDCTAQSCMNGGTCVDGLNAFTCDCPHLFSGTRCEINDCSLVGVCSGHGVCDGQGGCSCSSGWQGTDCELNVNECLTTQPCQHGSQCMDTQGSFTCTCAIGYRGATCDACDIGYYDEGHNVCCLIGYQGLACDQCQTGYEKINGQCQKTCQSTGLQCGANGTCNDNGGNPVCVCAATYFGPACDSLQGTCSVSACGGHGTCSPTSDTTYMCTCDTAYVGRSCGTLDECVLAVSQGQTPCTGHGTCIAGINTYSCQCNPGWLHVACDEPDDCYAAIQNGQNPCNAHGTCIDGNMAYTCSCDANWSGAHCDNYNDCVGNLCQHSGACVDGNSAYTCDCSGTGYQGTYCETKIDECLGVTACKNGSQCVDIGTTYQCDCTKTGYTGPTCEVDIDECAADSTLCNTGVCTNVGGGYICQCPDGLMDVDGDGKNCASVVSVAAGTQNSCAITTAGSLHCWGDNTEGQLANGTFTNATPRVPVRIGQASGWQSVSVGQRHICAIRSGHLFCWGNNSYWQTGPSAYPHYGSLVEIRSDLTWSAVSAGDTHTCAIAAGSLYCWGNTASGQAGAAVSGTKIDGPKQISGTYLAVSAGANHTCWITSANQLQCIGSNASGQLGGGTQPIPAPSGTWSSVNAGPTHTCATAGTTTYCWGAGTQGALGDGTASDSATPVAVSGVTGMSSLGTGQDFSCGVVPDVSASSFQLYCWGTNANGLLLTNDILASVPQLVTRGASKWTAYDVGNTHMCGVSDGLLVCWGSNADGALGTGSTNATPNNPPAAVMSAGITHQASSSCLPNPCQNNGVCTDTGSGYTCDCTNTGYTGTTCTSETDECTKTPGICGEGTCADLLGNQGYTCKCPDGQIDVDNTGTSCAKVSYVSAGSNHTCVLTEDTTLHCWGSNRYGQFGLGNIGTSDYYPDESAQTIRTPLRLKDVSGITGAVTGWTKLTVGEKHTCATRPTGMGTDALYCWGDNTNGQIGASTGLNTFAAAPVLLDNTQTWVALAAGYSHTCAIASSGALYCWGYSKNAQVGNGSSTTTPVPFSIATPVALPPGETGWATVACGASHTCATTNSQTMYCWGRNSPGAPPYSILSGQVGIGAVLGDITTPTKVALSDPQNLSIVTADFSHTCALQGTSAYCWGTNGSGAVGNGTFVTPQPSPVAVTGGLMFTSLESGSSFSCGLVQVTLTAPIAYDVYCWGSNSKDLLQTGGANVNVPTKVTTRQWEQFSVGVLHICAVDHATGLLNCWGDNGSEGSPAAGIGKLGWVPEGMIGTFGMGVVKTAVVTHPPTN